MNPRIERLVILASWPVQAELRLPCQTSMLVLCAEQLQLAWSALCCKRRDPALAT